MVDATDLKSVDFTIVRVQVPLSPTQGYFKDGELEHQLITQFKNLIRVMYC